MGRTKQKPARSLYRAEERVSQLSAVSNTGICLQLAICLPAKEGAAQTSLMQGKQRGEVSKTLFHRVSLMKDAIEKTL